MFRYLQNSLIFLFLYIPPLAFFIRSSLRRGINRFLLLIISLLYLLASIYTQNLLPFILVLINIRYIRYDNSSLYTDGEINYTNVSRDYISFDFDIKNFKLFKALKYASITYGITITVNVILTLLLYYYEVDLNEQEIVRELSTGSLKQLAFMTPIMVIFAPVLEEFTFRWLIFEKVFIPRLGVYASALVSSILFSLVHFNLRSFAVLMVISFINCYIIHRKGYWYAVFNHMVFNSVTVFIMLYQKIS